MTDYDTDDWEVVYTASMDDHTHEYDTYDAAYEAVVEWYTDENITARKLVHIYQVKLAPHSRDPQDQLEDEDELDSALVLTRDDNGDVVVVER